MEVKLQQSLTKLGYDIFVIRSNILYNSSNQTARSSITTYNVSKQRVHGIFQTLSLQRA